MTDTICPVSSPMLRAEKYNYNFTARCPATGKYQAITLANQVAIPGGQAIWWGCPGCGGWHVIIVDYQAGYQPAGSN